MISIGLPAPGPVQRLKTVDLDYEVRGRPLPAGGRLRPELPQIALPCLSFCWELTVPAAWRAADDGPGFEANDPTPARSWPLGALGIPSVSWTSRKHATQPSPGEVLVRRLDEAMRSAVRDESSFAEWFPAGTRWRNPGDRRSSRRPSLGHGPRSRCVPFGQDSGNRTISLKTLEQYGLALLPVDADTGDHVEGRSRTTRRRRAPPACRRRGTLVGFGPLGPVPDRGAMAGRGRLPRRHRPTGPREGPRSLPGWSTYWYTAASWPDESAYVVVVDERSRIVAGWMVAVAVLFGLGFGTAEDDTGDRHRACRDVRIADLRISGCRRGLTASRQGSSSVRCRSSSSGSVHSPGYRHANDPIRLASPGAYNQGGLRSSFRPISVLPLAADRTAGSGRSHASSGVADPGAHALRRGRRSGDRSRRE